MDPITQLGGCANFRYVSVKYVPIAGSVHAFAMSRSPLILRMALFSDGSTVLVISAGVTAQRDVQG